MDFLTKETIDISLFTQEIYSKICKLAQRNWQIDGRRRGTFYGERQRLTQAIINLAQNAVQHTEETDTITLGSKSNFQTVSFWIQDTGVGFNPQDKELIFKRFGRAGKNHRHSQGQGLGLSIVQAIAQAHKGQVEAIGELNSR
ncbi:ATP-binding protein [Myxosarcina sp. GI1]|uniref:ATP-binding protein n=1 Tax=Myxosarcina sp. GI1 TaxID=1541065 RepID=UPI0005673A28|nr:ATP-binding protein [Myxosarcina sp. GI1]